MSPKTATELCGEARSGLDRVAVDDLAAHLRAGALLVDLRPADERDREGDIEGAHAIGRNVLEWRFDIGSPHAHSEVTGYDQEIILVCTEGYASSLAAQSLQWLGYTRATDLIGGFRAWLRGSPQESFECFVETSVESLCVGEAA